MAYELFDTAVNAARGSDQPIVQHELPLLGKLDELQRGIVDGGATTQLIAITYVFTVGAASGLEIFNADVPFAFEIVDVIVQARATEGSGTLKITDGTNDITDLIACDTDKTRAVAATIDNAYSQIAVGGTLEVVCVGGTIADIQALVTILVIPT